jgi:ABC-type sugar transport system substrate-binding protein
MKPSANLRRLPFYPILLIFGLIAFTPISAPAGSAQEKAVYYWISHGPPSNPTWMYFLQGAEQWAKDTGNEIRTSFHSGDIPSQQEAIRAAISVKAKGIVTSTPDPGSLTKIIAEAHAAGIPVILMNIDAAQEVLDGYVKAAMWQDPQATSYLALSVAAMTASGIPPGFDISVGTLYERDQAPTYLKIMQGSAARPNK